MSEEKGYLYMLRCKGGGIYTGITNDYEKRFHAHFCRTAACAAYTRAFPPTSVILLLAFSSYHAAQKWEYAVKRLKKTEKEQIVADPERVFAVFPELSETAVLLPIPDRYKDSLCEKGEI